MIQVTDQRYLEQINEPFRGGFSAEVKLFFKSGERTFTDEDIFTISESESANIVADENPEQSAEITLSNYNHEFDINGTSGYFRDISDGIECQYRFGFQVQDDDGTTDTVWLDWKRRWCTGEATLSEKQVTFSVGDVFSTNEDEIEGYFSANYGLVVTNVFNKSTYPKQENNNIGVTFDTDLTNTVTYYQPSYTLFNEIIQSIAFASGKQFYIDHKGVVHIDDDRTTPTNVHLTTGDYFEDNEAGKEKKVKKITVSYYIGDSETVQARPDFVREMNGTGESVSISNDFICSVEDGNRVMSYLVNYYEKRGTFSCTFRGDPRLEPLDVITIDILNADNTVQTVTATIISIENTYDGTFESNIECKYLTSDTTDDVASITGAENFVYPLDSTVANPQTVTLTCTTSIPSPTKFVWEYYNMVTSSWTQIGTGNTLSVSYTTEWLSDDVTTTFRCTIDDRVSASVGIRRIYTTGVYTYLGIQQSAPPNPSTGDYYLSPTGLVYLWNGYEWVTTTRSDLLINAVADGKTLTGIENTPLGQLIASMQGADGQPGQPGADGKPGADGQPGQDGVSVTSVTSYYLATSKSSGVTTDTEGWTEDVQTMTETNKYLWTYQVTSFSDGHTETSTPYITGVYGDKGEQGEQGQPGTPGQDGQPGQDGTSPYILILSQDNFVFTADSEGNVSSNQFGVVASASIYHGDTAEDITTWTLSGVFTPDANFTGSIDTNGQITISSFASASDVGYATITATKGSITLTKVLRCTKSKQGATGTPGADGAPAKSLTLEADSYNFHTDSDGNVKPNQVITLTVQKQNILDDIVWADNKGINVPVNTMTYEFKSSVDIQSLSTTHIDGMFTSINYRSEGDIQPGWNIGVDADGNFSTPPEVVNPPTQVTVKDGICAELGNAPVAAPDGTYYNTANGTLSLFNSEDVLVGGHKYYIRFEKNDVVTEYMLAIGYWGGSDMAYVTLSTHNNVLSGMITAETNGHPELPYTGFLATSSADPSDIVNLKFLNPVVIDITANATVLNSLGFTTDEEIKNALDNGVFNNYGIDISSGGSSINPALDGTPTIFTITAGDLSSSVQIGYVKDGETGEPGKSIERIDTFYLATSLGSGVTVATEGWTKEPQTITSEKKYLWIYQDIYYTDDSFERTDPYISGVYGDKGDPGEGGTPSMVTLVPSATTYELSSRNVIQKQQVITVEARVSGGTGTPTWTITPTEADGYTTGKDTNTITITLPVGSSLTGFSVSANVTGIGEDVVYINGTPIGEPTIRFFEQRASAPTRSDNNGEPFITGDYYVTNDGVPMMYEEISNSWRQPNNGDKYYDQIMTNVGNWWLSKGNDITTTTAALYGYFRTIYSNNAIIDQLSVAGIRLQEGGIIQSTITLPNGTVRGYEPGDGETYGTTGFYLSADGTAEFYNMSAFGIFAKGSFQADAMVTGEGTSAITRSNLYSQYQADWTSQKSYQQTTNTSSYNIGDVYSMNISPDDTYAFWTSISFSDTYRNVYAYAMGIGDTTVSATRLTGIENAIEALSSTNYESVSSSVAIRRNGNGYQAVVVGGVQSNYTQRITVIDTTSATATATTHEYTKTNNPVQFATIPIFTDTQLLLYNAGSGLDLSSFGRYNEYQIGIADLQSDGGSYSFSWGASSAQSGGALWGKETEFELADIQNTSSVGGVYDAVNGRIWIWFVGNGKMFPTEFRSTNWRKGDRYRGNDYKLGTSTTDFNETKTSTYNDYVATDNGFTVITYGNNTAWETIEINENNAWTMQSFDFGSTRYGFMGWDGTYIYGKNLSTNRMYRGTKNEWNNGTQTDLGYTITSNITGKYLVDGDILSWSSNVKRTTHGQRMDNIISFFSQLLPKINPSTMSHMPQSEPLASVTACTGTVRIAGINRSIVRMGCSSSTLTIDTSSGSYVYKSGTLYDDTETVAITSLTISQKAASVNTKNILPQANNRYDIGASNNYYRSIYCDTLFADEIGAGSDKVSRIYATYIGNSSNKVTTIYTTNLHLGSYTSSTSSTTGYTSLPNGFLLQWGSTPSASSSNTRTIVFPRTFSRIYSFVAMPWATRDSDVQSRSIVLRKTLTVSQAILVFNTSSDYGQHWIAIGR